jgi:hypothetical protein
MSTTACHRNGRPKLRICDVNIYVGIVNTYGRRRGQWRRSQPKEESHDSRNSSPCLLCEIESALRSYLKKTAAKNDPVKAWPNGWSLETLACAKL